MDVLSEPEDCLVFRNHCLHSCFPGTGVSQVLAVAGLLAASSGIFAAFRPGLEWLRILLTQAALVAVATAPAASVAAATAAAASAAAVLAAATAAADPPAGARAQ